MNQNQPDPLLSDTPDFPGSIPVVDFGFSDVSSSQNPSNQAQSSTEPLSSAGALNPPPPSNSPEFDMSLLENIPPELYEQHPAITPQTSQQEETRNPSLQNIPPSSQDSLLAGYEGSAVIDDFWVHQGPGFDEIQVGTTEFLDSVNTTLYPPEIPDPTIGLAEVALEIDALIEAPISQGMDFPGISIPVHSPSSSDPLEAEPIPPSSSLESVFSQIEAHAKEQVVTESPTETNLLYGDEWDFSLDFPSLSVPPPPSHPDIVSGVSLEESLPRVQSVASPPSSPPSTSALIPHEHFSYLESPAPERPLMPSSSTSSSAPHTPSDWPESTPPSSSEGQNLQQSPPESPLSQENVSDLMLEDIHVLEVIPLKAEQSFIFVQIKTRFFALMGVAGDAFFPLKLFHANPKHDPELPFAATPETTIANIDFYHIELGSWQGVIAIENNTMILVSEFRGAI